jgi:hypothetical protein
MDSLLDKAGVVMAAIAALGALGLLHCVACALRNHKHVHDLRVRVGTLRNEQIKRLTEGGLSPMRHQGDAGGTGAHADGRDGHGEHTRHAKAA